MPRISLAAAVAEVRKRDPVLDRLVARIGPIRYRPRHPDGHFGTLVRAIVFQQLAGSAAQAIFDRVVTAAGGGLTPESLAAVSDGKLRAAGLSQNKLLALRDLSAKVLDGSVDLRASPKQSDDEIVAKLVTVRGIGKWTAEMYLLFELRRFDVWPVRRSRRPPGLRDRLGSGDAAQTEGAARAWRAVPAIPFGRRAVLLGGGPPLPVTLWAPLDSTPRFLGSYTPSASQRRSNEVPLSGVRRGRRLEKAQ